MPQPELSESEPERDEQQRPAARLDTGGGDLVQGDKIMGDKVLRDKHVHYHLPEDTGQQRQAPFMVGQLPDHFVERPEESERLVALLTAGGGQGPVALTGIRGAGGYGKTELARAVCHDPRIRKAYDAGILWVTLGEKANPVSGLTQIYEAISGKRPAFLDLEDAVNSTAKQVGGRRMLLVVDDVWNEADLRPFLRAGEGCARLITTRDRETLPRGTAAVDVAAMKGDEAVSLLAAGLGQADRGDLRALAGRLGEWPLLLKLANRVLYERIEDYKQSWADGLAYVNARLDRYGLVAFDAQDAKARDQAAATLEVSLETLGGERERFEELAIFPQDLDIPLETVQKLWGSAGGLDGFECEELCGKLYRGSLLLGYDPGAMTIRLHDMVRGYLRGQLKERLPIVQRTFLASYAVEAWADLAQGEPYLWDHLATHLIEAGFQEQLAETVKDLRYLGAKTLARSCYAAEKDLAAAMVVTPGDRELLALKKVLEQFGHLFNRCRTMDDIRAALYCRARGQVELAELAETQGQLIDRVWIAPWSTLPDAPEPKLVRTLRGHKLRVTDCAFSPDGRWIASASDDGTVKVWDAGSGEERLRLDGHDGPVNGCAFSPDGHWIAAASGDGTVKLWDAGSRVLRLTLRGHDGAAYGCAFSPDGGRIASASYDRTVKVWDAGGGELLLTLRGHQKAIKGCAFSPDGRWIASASDDGTVKVWDASNGEELLTLRGHGGWVTGCAFSPDGRWIPSASYDGTVKVWDASNGEELLTLRGHEAFVTNCDFSPNGGWIASADSDGTVKLWDAGGGEERLTSRGHEDAVTCCVFSPDGRAIALAFYDGTVKVWGAGSRELRLTLGEEHLYGVFGCAFSPDGRWIASASEDQTVKVWDAGSGEERLTLSGHEDLVNGCAFSPDGRWIASASFDKTVKVWDADSGEERLTLLGHEAGVNGCAFSPDGGQIASASDDGTVKVWDSGSGEERLTLLGHEAGVKSCAFSPNGDQIASASNDRTVKLWDAGNGGLRLTLRGHEYGVNGCAFSPDGRRITTASRDGMVKLWETHDGYCLATFYADGSLNDIAFSPDGKHLAAVGNKGIYFLEIRGGEASRT